MVSAFNLVTDSVRNEEGNVDVERTVEKFRGVLLQHTAERETEATTIGNAVNAVLDRHLGSKFTLNTLINFVLTELNAQPQNFQVLRDRVDAYLHEHSGKRESGKPFGINKGRNLGGVCRWADVPVPAAK